MISQRKTVTFHKYLRRQFRISILCILLLTPMSFFPSMCTAVESVEILSFGDSLTQGCYLSSEGTCGKESDGQGSPYGYPSWLQIFIAESGIEAVVRNFGHGGEKTDEGVGRLASVLNNPCTGNASYVLILEGTNDLLASGYADPETIRFNLEAMVNQVVQYGKQPLLATIPPDIGHPFKLIEEMNDLIRQLAAKREDVILVDLYSSLVGSWYDYIYPQGCYQDETHPNIGGFQAMAGVWYSSIMALPEFNPKPLPWIPLLLSGGNN